VAPLTARRSLEASTMLSVYSGRECVGFILKRSREGYEAFDVHEKSLGLYPSQHAAIAVLKMEPTAGDRE
jgi:hypothetical protein